MHTNKDLWLGQTINEKYVSSRRSTYKDATISFRLLLSIPSTQLRTAGNLRHFITLYQDIYIITY